ncbi:aminopeptidase N [Streptomyces capoamus]|uniref:Aminopeptidase N n=1 Tax=Streptomyces capoamus TaxID=68183 RepID=A0A919C2E4_9ACTN|nr:aminopeptidase N [Streptomyces capoamus]GGW16463.1 aminopeptidase N [Streptomyces libani subsp. rufus]GHG42908.1 aminopeptidase N [Streptomyces capoamus]
MPGTNLTAQEAAHRSHVVTVDTYDIALDLRAAADSATFPSVTEIGFDCADPDAPLFLDLRAPEVREVVVNGHFLDPDQVFQDSRIALAHLVAGRNEVRVVAACAYTNTGEGLHRFTDPLDGGTYLYSQFEVADARRVFACFDQPDLKAQFRFTVTAPADWTVLSNSGTVTVTGPRSLGDDRDGDGTGGRAGATVWSFDPTPRLSTYVVSLVAGPYHAVRAEHRRGDRTIPLGLYCRKSLAPHLDPDEILAVTRQGFDWFEERFGHPYPFEKYDQIFVPGFNAGAMENAAAVTFHEKYVFRSRATEAARRKRAATILHELSHMWFGDLVTMAWWNDLWLNESFATYSSFACQALGPDPRWADAWTTFANHQKAKAYRQDQLPSTHPVVAEIRDLDDVLVNFDGITYAKGASVLKQLVAYVGTDAFFAGVRAYFAAHAYGNTRLEDLLAALEEASGRDLGSWSKQWLETPGINVLRPEIETDPNGIVTAFRVHQEAPALPPGVHGTATLRPHRIAVGCYTLEGADQVLRRTYRTELDVAAAAYTDVPDMVGRRRPDVVLVNDDDLSYAKLRFDEASLRTLTRRLGSIADPLPRALCWAAAWDMTRDGELAARDYVGLVLSAIGSESDIGVVETLHRQVRQALADFTDPAARDRLTVAWADAALARSRTAAPGSDHQLAWARAFVAAARTGEHLDLLTTLLAGGTPVPGLTLDTELRWDVVVRLAATGRLGEDGITAEQRRDPTPAGECRAATARAARPDATAKAAAWASVVERGDLPNQLQRAVIAGFAETPDLALLAPYTDRYFAAVLDVWRTRSHEMAKQIVLGLFPAAAHGRAALDGAEAWLERHSVAPPALRRLILEQYDDAARALRAQATDRARRG